MRVGDRVKYRDLVAQDVNWHSKGQIFQINEDASVHVEWDEDGTYSIVLLSDIELAQNGLEVILELLP